MRNINDNNDKLFKLYTLAEIAYENKFKQIVSKDELYPDGWYSIRKYKQKILIIAEAIKTNNLIINTSSYQNLINSVKHKKYFKE